ncbi:MAG: LysE family transporter [Parachlamydiales bacterium]|jgi:threonine/homoserine/homoserine lactone efflux protein
MILAEINLTELVAIHPVCEDGVTCLRFFWKGAVIGAAIAIPVGPIAILCMQYALSKGFRTAFAAGLGAALADMCFGLVAGLGLSVITDWILYNKCWIQMLGGFFLCYIGAELCFTKSHKAALIDQKDSRISALGSTFMLTLANPLTILAFMALFGTFGLVEATNNIKNTTLTVVGVFLGSLTWWTILTYAASKMRGFLTDKSLLRFREIGGALLLACGVYALLACI